MAKRRSNKPYIQLNPERVPVSYFDDKGETINYKNYVEFPTYRKLVAELKKVASMYTDTWQVYVFRSRRAEWGEWFERWEATDGKISITKQGWM